MKRLTIFNSSSNGARVSESLSSTNHPLAANSAADCAFNAMNAIVVVTFSPSLPLFSPCTRFSERQFRSSSRQIRTLSPQPKDNSCAETVDPFCPERERERERERQREREREREREGGRDLDPSSSLDRREIGPRRAKLGREGLYLIADYFRTTEIPLLAISIDPVP